MQKTEFHSLAEAAKYANVTRQAIYLAIAKGHLKAEKRPWLTKEGRRCCIYVISLDDLEDYRKTKYQADKRVIEGQKLIDISQDRWSVLHASKTLSAMLGYPIPTYHLYYLLRIGHLRGFKKGKMWIIKKDELMRLYAEKAQQEEKVL